MTSTQIDLDGHAGEGLAPVAWWIGQSTRRWCAVTLDEDVQESRRVRERLEQALLDHESKIN